MKTFNDFVEARKIVRSSQLSRYPELTPPPEEEPEFIPQAWRVPGYSSGYGSLMAAKVPQTKPDAMKDYVQLVKLKRILKNTQAQIAELEAKIRG